MAASLQLGYKNLDMTSQTICEIDEDTDPISSTDIEAFETEHNLSLPDLICRILTETNGGFVREEHLLLEEDGETIGGVEQLNGISSEEVDWASSIVPLERWVKFKHSLSPSFPDVAALEQVNGDISRFFVISNSRTVFHLLDYTDSKDCKGFCYLNLAEDDQIIKKLGDDISSIIALT